MIYILTNETVKTICNKLENLEISSLSLYKDDIKEYYVCKIELLDDIDKSHLLDRKLLKRTIFATKEFYLLYCLNKASHFKLDVNLLDKNYNVENDYSLSTYEINSVLEAVRSIEKAFYALEATDVDLAITGLYTKNNRKYDKANLLYCLSAILNTLN